MIGASCRAAAQSARRALGDSVTILGCDLFGDADLRNACDNVRVIPSENFPAVQLAELNELLKPTTKPDSQSTAWMYCGGLENAPESIHEISEHLELLGCDATTVRAVRDPIQFTACLRDAGLPLARIITKECAGEVPVAAIKTSRWIAKPIGSCGGHHVGSVFFDSDATAPALIAANLDPATFAQQFVGGESQSACFVANGNEAVCLGTTRGYALKDVIPSHPSATDKPFGYAGSTGPLSISAVAQKKWQDIADALTARFRLKGLFGVDAIATPDGEIVPIEVNPRYTASMELIESATQRSMVRLHIDACVSGTLPEISGCTAAARSKQIVYARAPTQFSAAHFGAFLDAWQDHAKATRKEVDFADLPFFESPDVVRSFERGQPIMTVLSRGERFLAERPYVGPPFKTPEKPVS